ncbi:potassium channel family protein [candidate division KSB1 bacterium]
MQFRNIPIIYKRLATILLLVIGLYAVGTIGYIIIEDASFVDSFLMTAATLTTTGHTTFVELTSVASKNFTSLLMVFGVSILTYAAITLISSIVEGQLRNTFRDRKMEKTIKKLKDHIILCGYGRLGSHAGVEFKRWNKDFVVIEYHNETAEALKEQGVLCINGSAVDDSVLIAAGIERAKGLIAALAEDTDNLFVTLSARRLNRNLEIIARANYESTEIKLISAGADKVILPTQIAGRRMACMLTQPEVASFLDVVVETTEMDLSLQEIDIEAGGKLDGVLIREANMPHQIRIIGLKEAGKKMTINPGGNHRLEAGQKLVVLGENHEIELYREKL